MAEKGYRGTSIAQVAARAGISQSGLLHHFPTKQDLLIAVIGHRHDLDARLLENRGGGSLQGWGAFDALIDLVRHNSEHPQLVRMFVTLCAEAMDPDHPAHGWVRHHYADAESTLITAIEAGVADGDDAAGHPSGDRRSADRVGDGRSPAAVAGRRRGPRHDSRVRGVREPGAADLGTATHGGLTAPDVSGGGDLAVRVGP